MADKAQITTTYDVQSILPNEPYKVYFNITNFERALTLAGQFQEYRCDKVELIFQPEFNTFQDGQTATVPYLLSSMNRIGERIDMTRAVLERRGAVPIKFTREIKKVYKPNTLIGVAAVHQIVAATNPGGIPGGSINWSFTPKYDQWLSSEILQSTPGQGSAGGNTMESAGFAPPNYYGLDFLVDQDGDAVPEVPVGKLTIKAHWSFHQPRTLTTANTNTVYNATAVFQQTN